MEILFLGRQASLRIPERSRLFDSHALGKWYPEWNRRRKAELLVFRLPRKIKLQKMATLIKSRR